MQRMSAKDVPDDGPAEPKVALGPVDFSTHVLSLASSALVALGRMPAPSGETMKPDLDTGKYLVDVLGMLEEKTRGNLDDAETKLIQSLLYDLRVAFVDASNAAQGYASRSPGGGARRRRPLPEPADAVHGHAAGTRPPSDAAPGAPGTTGRSVLYSETPGSFVGLVANARDGVVAIRGSTPVKGGPAAMFPGAAQAAGDVALGSAS